MIEGLVVVFRVVAVVVVGFLVVVDAFVVLFTVGVGVSAEFSGHLMP